MAKVSKRQTKLNEIDELKRKAKLLEEEFEKLVKEQETNRDKIKEEINSLISKNKLFCGVILTEESLLGLLKLKFANPKENIRIPFQLYIEED